MRANPRGRPGNPARATILHCRGPQRVHLGQTWPMDTQGWALSWAPTLGRPGSCVLCALFGGCVHPHVLSPRPGTPTKAPSSLRGRTVPTSVMAIWGLCSCLSTWDSWSPAPCHSLSCSLSLRASFSAILVAMAILQRVPGGGWGQGSALPLQPPPSPRPGTCRAPWLGLILGDLRAFAGLADFSVDNGRWGMGRRWEQECGIGGAGGVVTGRGVDER